MNARTFHRVLWLLLIATFSAGPSIADGMARVAPPVAATHHALHPVPIQPQHPFNAMEAFKCALMHRLSKVAKSAHHRLGLEAIIKAGEEDRPTWRITSDKSLNFGKVYGQLIDIGLPKIPHEYSGRWCDIRVRFDGFGGLLTGPTITWSAPPHPVTPKQMRPTPAAPISVTQDTTRSAKSWPPNRVPSDGKLTIQRASTATPGGDAPAGGQIATRIPSALTRAMGNIAPYRKDLLLRLAQNWHPPKPNTDVILLLSIDHDGRLIDSEVFQSSGNKKIDQLALTTSKATQYSPLPDWFKGEQLTFKVELSKVEATQDADGGAAHDWQGFGSSHYDHPIPTTRSNYYCDYRGPRLRVPRDVCAVVSQRVARKWHSKDGPSIWFTLAHASGARHIRIASSSGDPALDKRALRMMRFIFFPTLPDTEPSKYITFELNLTTMKCSRRGMSE